VAIFVQTGLIGLEKASFEKRRSSKKSKRALPEKEKGERYPEGRIFYSQRPSPN